MSKDSQAVIEEFQQNVNMTAKEIENWLKTDESKSVGQKDGNQESIGHESGRHIVEILQKKEANYTEDDLSQMQRVVSYIKRHSAQKPASDIEDSRWRYSLMNWGHDPLK
ncbi:DNA-binding protein [[Phormidium ambiguum] IAM M-71]|uniref:DNA-binding protein n=1 Tax=[Phormidium ambiguum] IAM M-71 TaxID=454136 RepID=A0A1U7IK59_9CYAN|nr:DUF3140 domain-containing protein [Phormidium ambiguum]OKH37555.1 DNA-binding protein [Phormidium ambiguum IAM M-71]